MALSTSLPVVLLYCLLLGQGLTRAIRITKLKIPTRLAVGDGGWLECDWEDEGDMVYSLKWYTGIDEFYRWTPLEDPAVKTFENQHFVVDPHESERGRVRIHNVTIGAEGNYRCEVSGEAPVFKTSFKSDIMTVVVLPEEGPKITGGGRQPLKLHQRLAFNCSSRDALPAPNITFYINDQPVDPAWEGRIHVASNKSSSLETVWKSLKFQLPASLAPHGLLQVKCVAFIHDLYFKSATAEFSVDVPRKYSYPVGSPEYIALGSTSACLASYCSVLLLLLLLRLVR